MTTQIEIVDLVGFKIELKHSRKIEILKSI